MSGLSLDAIVARFRDVPTSIISDNLDRLRGANGIRPFHKGGKLAGVATTIKTRAGDNLIIHEALAQAPLGNVLVIDGESDVSRALVGEIMVEIAIHRELAGIVIDGAIRDVGAIALKNFPCYARGFTHRGPYKNGPGYINVPVSIGGMIVNPGDILIGDEDGVVAFSPNEAEFLLAAAKAQQDREDEILASIRADTYSGSYAAGKE